ncbi:MAG TPA: hypothetical protein VFC44_25925, partial [Candidatus Saccharimonadales bacterium]|nr:hypothetical protein [Candidatus Saccharimonadales bacterium]
MKITQPKVARDELPWVFNVQTTPSTQNGVISIPPLVAFHPTLFRVDEAEWVVSQRSRRRVNAGLDDTIPLGLPKIGEISLPLAIRQPLDEVEIRPPAENFALDLFKLKCNLDTD